MYIRTRGLYTHTRNPNVWTYVRIFLSLRVCMYTRCKSVFIDVFTQLYVRMLLSEYEYMYIYIYTCIHINTHIDRYMQTPFYLHVYLCIWGGTISGIDKIVCLFCRKLSLLQVSFAKETYNLIDPINRSLPIRLQRCFHHALVAAGWRRLIGCLKLQVVFRKRATNYRALLRKMTYEDKASYHSMPPCRSRVCKHHYKYVYVCMHICTCVQMYIFRYIKVSIDLNMYICRRIRIFVKMDLFIMLYLSACTHLTFLF